MFICIAGKNQCSIDVIKILAKHKINKKNIFILPNSTDKGRDTWQPSLKKYALKNKFKIVKLDELYGIKDLIFFSLEYEKIINVNKFESKSLFNYHFSLLPKYRGCHTNFLQIFNGEKYTGVTLHKINKGIDTGNIIDQKKFKIMLNDTAYDNYIKLMNCSVKLFKKNLYKIMKSSYKEKKQILSKGSYYKRSSVDYKKIIKINTRKQTLRIHNKIRSLIFPPYQMPIVNGIQVKKSIYRKDKIYLIESSTNRYKNR
tara:strand:- start:2092 stop:2862 length:771 start_codon:yes stop_codon:yes gene_type:complete